MKTVDYTGKTDPLGNSDTSIQTRYVYSGASTIGEYVLDDCIRPANRIFDFGFGFVMMFP